MPLDIPAALLSLRDTVYRDFQCSLMPTADAATVIGVRTPLLRRMAKELCGTPIADKFLTELPHAFFEENQLHAFLLEHIKDFDEAITAVDAFLPYVDNWATCDQLSPKAFKGRFGDLKPHIDRWMTSPHEYTLRFGIGMLMRYGLDKDFDTAHLEAVAAPAVSGREEYYIRMMVAWFFATALAKQYEAALPYIIDRRLPVWTHNMTIRKARESYRVPDEHKRVLKALRGEG